MDQKLEDMLDAMVDSWLISHGDIPRTQALEILDEKTNEELAGELIEDYGLDEHCADESYQSHMEKYKYTKDDLIEAFARVRAWHNENFKSASDE